ncbi:MAG TPA: hypothetical protein VHR43_05340 [Gemmatimonadales bacterium]|nr:hypothetical protein [Gemmatimonadales bacterium]
MRVRPGVTPGERGLFQSDHQIGYIRDGQVGFTGFGTRIAGAQAAYTGHRALTRRRTKTGILAEPPGEILVSGHGDEPVVVDGGCYVAQLRRTATATGEPSWGFELPLLPEERGEVFATSRARTVWNALRASGLSEGPRPPAEST